jgi:hypothetical protein
MVIIRVKKIKLIAITPCMASAGLCIIRINKNSDINQMIEKVIGERSMAGIR